MPVDDKGETLTSPSIKSRPLYTPLTVDRSGREHLLVAEAPALETSLRLLNKFTQNGASVEVYWLGDIPDTLNNNPVLVRAFKNPTSLTNALKERLIRSSIGTRLYLAGRETFIWENSIPARMIGIREDEIQREACGSRARCVFCVHCRCLLKDVMTNPVACPGCGTLLEVRDHFSRSMAAYMGVIINAENPCDVPEPEEQFI